MARNHLALPCGLCPQKSSPADCTGKVIPAIPTALGRSGGSFHGFGERCTTPAWPIPLQAQSRWDSSRFPSSRSIPLPQLIPETAPLPPRGGSRLEGDTLAHGHGKFSGYTGGPTQVVLLNGIKQRGIMLPQGSSGELCTA